jgi:hypothetical protein
MHHPPSTGDGDEYYRKNFEAYLRQLHSSHPTYKRWFPQEIGSIYDQYLHTRTISGSINSTVATTVLEWTLVDTKYILQLYHAPSPASSVDACLSSNLLHSIHDYTNLYIPSSLSINLTSLQQATAHLLPLHHKPVIYSDNSILSHPINTVYHLRATRGLLLSGSAGSGKKSLLKQLLHAQLGSVDKHWISHTSTAAIATIPLAQFITQSRHRLQCQRYEQHISNIGALFLEDLHLGKEQDLDTIHHLLQFNILYDQTAEHSTRSCSW